MKKLSHTPGFCLAITVLIIMILLIHPVTADTSQEPLGSVSVITGTGTIGEEIIDFTWRNSEGNTASLSDYRGKVVLVNFWATWCIPCIQEIPHLIELHGEMTGDTFAIIGISVDEPSDMPKVDMFIETRNMPYVNILADRSVLELFGNIRAVPTTVLIDKEGKIAQTIVGIRTKNQLLELINPLM